MLQKWTTTITTPRTPTSYNNHNLHNRYKPLDSCKSINQLCKGEAPNSSFAMTTKIYPKPNLIIQTTPKLHFKPHIKMQVLPPCKQLKKIEIKSKLSLPPKSPRQKASSTNLRQNLQKIKLIQKSLSLLWGQGPTNTIFPSTYIPFTFGKCLVLVQNLRE